MSNKLKQIAANSKARPSWPGPSGPWAGSNGPGPMGGAQWAGPNGHAQWARPNGQARWPMQAQSARLNGPGPGPGHLAVGRINFQKWVPEIEVLFGAKISCPEGLSPNDGANRKPPEAIHMGSFANRPRIAQYRG
jgi:hypothetical protein